MIESRMIRRYVIGIDFIFLAIAAINIIELVDILVYNESYPFGAEFFGPYSIYKSKQGYLAFKAMSISLILFMLAFSILRYRTLFWILVLLNTLLLCYTFVALMPIITSSMM